MFKSLRAAALVAAALLLIGAAPASAAPTSFSFSGKGASAFWESTDGSGVTTSTGIGFDESSSREGGSRERGSSAWYFQDRYIVDCTEVDPEWGECEYTWVGGSFGSGPITKSQYSVGKNLGGASLTSVLGVMPVIEWDPFSGEPLLGDSVPTAISASWQATGPVERGSDFYRYRWGNDWGVFHGTGVWRPATATVSIDGVAMAATDWADIHNFRSGGVGSCGECF